MQRTFIATAFIRHSGHVLKPSSSSPSPFHNLYVKTGLSQFSLVVFLLSLHGMVKCWLRCRMKTWDWSILQVRQAIMPCHLHCVLSKHRFIFCYMQYMMLYVQLFHHLICETERPSQTWSQNHLLVTMFGSNLSAIVIHNKFSISFSLLSLCSNWRFNK